VPGKTKEKHGRKPIKHFYPLTDDLKSIHNYLVNNKVLNSSYFVFFCGGLLGALFFIYTFGTAILDFTYIDWLKAGYADLASTQIGWELFRHSTWYLFPFFETDSMVYPFKLGVFGGNVISPVFFKLLSPVLPNNFQFCGLEGIVNYILQGGIGALIIKKIGGNTVHSIIGSLFFTLSTVMMWRMYYHTSLAQHYIILLCILFYLQNNNFSLKKKIFIWNGLLFLSLLTMAYFAVMVMVFIFFSLLREYLITKNVKNQLIVFGVSVLVMAGTMFYLGAFNYIGGLNTSGSYFGECSANFNTFVNPQGVSSFVKDMPLITQWQYEGFAYLGLGLILFVIVVIFQYIQKREPDLRAYKTEMLPVIGIVLAFFIFSMSPTITFNQHTLFTYPVIQPIKRLWSMFRSTGRMTWPIVYIIMTFCIWRAITQFSVKKSILILSVFLIVQWADLKPWFVGKGEGFKTKVTWQSALSSPVWNDLAGKYKHIFFMGNLPGYSAMPYFLNLAAEHKMTVNNSYLGSIGLKKIWDNVQKESEYLMKNGPKNDMIYVFQDINQASLYKDKVYLYNVDNVIIGIDSRINLP